MADESASKITSKDIFLLIGGPVVSAVLAALLKGVTGYGFAFLVFLLAAMTFACIAGYGVAKDKGWLAFVGVFAACFFGMGAWLS